MKDKGLNRMIQDFKGLDVNVCMYSWELDKLLRVVQLVVRVIPCVSSTYLIRGSNIRSVSIQDVSDTD